VSAYRLHLDDPVDFEHSLSMYVDHGLNNAMTGDYSSVVFWYQYEPHVPFPPLPPLSRRLPAPPWINVVQWLIGVSIAVLLVIAFAYIV
jgi:hypothetical protein